MNPRDKALAIATALASRKGIDVLVLDLHEISSFTDFFVITSGTSTRHVKSLAEATMECMRGCGERSLGVEGDPPGRWILVDLGDVVVHLFEPSARDFYSLERLWGEAERLSVPDVMDAELAEAAR